MENVNLSHLPKSLQDKINELKLEFDEGEITEKGFRNRLNRIIKDYQENNPPPIKNIREDAVKEALSNSKNKLDSVTPRKRETSTYANANLSTDEEDQDNAGSETDSSIGDLIHDNPHIYSNSSDNTSSRRKNRTSKNSDAFDKLVANAAAQLAQAVSINPNQNSPRISERMQSNGASNSLMTIDENNEQNNFVKSQPSEDSGSMASFGQISGLSSQDNGSLNNSQGNLVMLRPSQHLVSNLNLNNSNGPPQPNQSPQVQGQQSNLLRSAQMIAAGGGGNMGNNRNISMMNRQVSSSSNCVPVEFVCEERVTDKIRKLVNTLKRPKIRPLEENFIDDKSAHLASISEDPNAPKPKGNVIKVVQGDPLQAPSGLPRNLELALSRYAGLNEKAPAISCMTTKCTLSQPLTFHKLKQKALKIAFVLLNKLGHKNELCLKPRDRVALVYGNNEPMSFIISFYACILASLVPIAIEVPSSRRDSSCQSMGFLLSSQEISIVLTSDQCYRSLKKSPVDEILSFPGWPKVAWINCDVQILNRSAKPPKDWQPPERLSPNEPMFTEYSYNKDGNVHGVVHSRQSALTHCRALTMACGYTEGDVMVCVLDMRRELGLWHAVLASVYNGIHVVFVPYSVMQIDPGSWLKMVTKFQASVALAKSRDLHWGMLYDRDHKSINLSSLRMILLENGSNPWSQSSCEEFANKFIPLGLCPDVICPAAGSPEATTVCLRRPLSSSVLASKRENMQNNTISSAKGNISMHALSYSVVRVDSENDRTSLTLQDCGQVLPGVSLVTVKLGDKPILCKTDEVGEICISSDFSPTGYWGLEGATENVFHVKPLNENLEPIDPTKSYVRTGFVGFPGPAASGGLIFICGTTNGLIEVDRRYHNADDIIATILAVPPNRLIFRNRIAVFGMKILNEERVVVVGELRNDVSEKAAYHWMSQVMQAVESIHQFSIYCILMVGQHNLPKTPFGGINIHEVKRMLDQGCLSPTVLMMSPHSAILNLPIARSPISTEVGPSAMMVGQMIQGVRLAEAQGRSLIQPNTQLEIKYIPNLLTWRAEHTPDDILFSIYNQKGQECSKITAGQMHAKVEKMKSLLIHGSIAKSVQLQPGSVVALMFPTNCAIELAAAFYACLSLGIIAVIVKPPWFDIMTAANSSSSPVSSLSAMLGFSPKTPNMSQSRLSLNGSSNEGSVKNGIHGSTTNLSSSSSNISGYAVSGPPPATQAKFGLENSLEMALSVIAHSKALCIVTNSGLIKIFKSKQITSMVPLNQWPPFVDCDEFHRKKNVPSVSFGRCENITAYLDFNISTTGTLTSVPVTHSMINVMCHSQKMQCEFYPTMKVLLSLDPISGMGMSFWLLTSLYCGHHTILIPPSILECNPEMWITIVNQEEIRDTFCTYSVIESSLRLLSKQIIQLKHKNVSLSRLRSLIIVAEERPRVQLTNAFIKLFSLIGLNARSVSTSFGCKTNPSICLQGSTSPDLTTVYVDKIALRNDRIKLVEKGSPNSMCLMESGKLLPGIHVVIANPDTLGQCSDSQLGEIWIESPHNATSINGPFAQKKIKGQLNSSPLFGMISLSNSQGSLAELSDSNPSTSSQGLRGQNLGALQNQQKLPKSGVNADMGCGEQLNATLATGDTLRKFVRTGFLGFVRRTDRTQSDGHAHDALFVVGSLEEAIILRGMRYHPIDIETTVLKSHRKICQCAVFTWSNLLVVVAELMGHEYEALDMVHPIVSRVVEDHQLIVGVVVIVDPGTIPVSHQGDKQRILLRDRFVSDLLDPIYVSYNM